MEYSLRIIVGVIVIVIVIMILIAVFLGFLGESSGIAQSLSDWLGNFGSSIT